MPSDFSRCGRHCMPRLCALPATSRSASGSDLCPLGPILWGPGPAGRGQWGKHSSRSLRAYQMPQGPVSTGDLGGCQFYTRLWNWRSGNSETWTRRSGWVTTFTSSARALINPKLTIIQHRGQIKRVHRHRRTETHLHDIPRNGFDLPHDRLRDGPSAGQ